MESIERKSPGFSIVGIGASAGGLEALTEFLRQMPADTGLGFVVVTHLDPNRKSMLAELLGKESSMPVRQIENGMVVERNHVYVIPPDTSILIEGSTLLLAPREHTGARLPIDGFFRSLAESLQDRAVGIILSGTGSDGSSGLGAIKERGGTTLVQEPHSAAFDAMPRNAIATGSADFVFPLEALARAMQRIGHNLSPKEANSTLEGQLAPDDEMHFEQILAMLNHVVGVDFREYRKNSIRRRLRRRLVIQDIPSLREYVRHLETNPDELRILAQDFLIRVTRFFRDPEVFDALRYSIFPHLLRDPDHTPIRVWVPGCASGEEVYSIAMSFVAAARTLSSQVPVQIFGSDVNPAAIEIARNAIYPENIALDVSPEYLEQFFTHTGGNYQLRKSLRELCVFSVHDITRDPPLGRMDVVSFRNVMIYFDSPLQKKVMPRLHFALKPDGYLIIGKAETTSTFSHLFGPIDKKTNIFVRKTPFQKSIAPTGRPGDEARNELSYKTGTSSNLQRHVEQTIAGQYGPPAIVVNEDLTVLYAHGDVERYLRPATEDLNLSTHEVGPEQLRTTLRLAMEQIRRSGEAIRSNGCHLDGERESEVLNIIVIPMGAKEASFLVLLESSRDVLGSHRATSEETLNGAGQSDHPSRLPALEAEIESLRHECRTSKTHLRTLLSEHQAASRNNRPPTKNCKA